MTESRINIMRLEWKRGRLRVSTGQRKKLVWVKVMEDRHSLNITFSLLFITSISLLPLGGCRFNSRPERYYVPIYFERKTTLLCSGLMIKENWLIHRYRGLKSLIQRKKNCFCLDNCLQVTNSIRDNKYIL